MLTWNLFHGRTAPEGSGRPLLDEFSARLAGWEWDVALLQEVPPWWPPELGRAAGAEHRTVLTSRNALLPLRRALAERWPDVVKSQGGGANALLCRGSLADHRAERLRWLPERRVVQFARTADGTCLANLHAQGRRDRWARADVERARRAALDYAGEAPLVLGGDLNVRDPHVPGLELVASHHVDHVLVRGLRATGPGETLRRGRLSDHAPLTVEVRR